MHTLPSHILSALSGNLIAVNTIIAPIAPRRAQPLNGESISINLTSSISVIDDSDYSIDVHTIDGDNTHISIE